jgi:hypothetical protein
MDFVFAGDTTTPHAKGKRAHQVTESILKAFFGIWLHQSNNIKPEIRDYWQKATKDPWIKKISGVFGSS